jgi:hypothetical protein
LPPPRGTADAKQRKGKEEGKAGQTGSQWNERPIAMDRHAKFIWMKEVLEHLHDCHREWEVAEGKAERFLAETIKRDLDEVRRICESLTVRGGT